MTRVGVAIATAGRRGIIEETLPLIVRQTWPDVRYIIVAPDEDSFPRPERVPEGVELLLSDRGLTKQRNRALDELQQDCEFVFFFDDDAVPAVDYVEQAVRVFNGWPALAGVTGTVLADGANAESAINLDEAEQILASRRPETTETWRTTKELYGCNFGVRSSSARDLRFDEELPLYGWLEDLDFARRLARRGALARVGRAAAVHLGARSGGRMDHRKFGYWQVSNPAHFVRTGSFSLRVAAAQVIRPVLANVVGAMVPSRQDRRQRLQGNLDAVVDVLRRRDHPGRAVR